MTADLPPLPPVPPVPPEQPPLASQAELQPQPVVPTDSAHPTVSSDLSDGDWHRMHPLTPLMQGGVVLLVLFAIVISRMQDELLGLLIPRGRRTELESFDGNPIDWVLANDLLVWALLAIAGVLVLFVVGFYFSWRFHKFRITEADVEVTKGILFRSHRRAPLDRVQGVNLTRPLFARIIGLAKLEVVGAGNDANVPLEYLTTRNAEQVRADILRLASGARLARQERLGGAAAPRQHLLDTVGESITGLVSGAVEADVAPESVVRIPTGRVVGSSLMSTTTLAFVLLVGAIIVVSTFTEPWALFSLVPAVIGLGGLTISQLFKALRYSIAPTPDGVRVTFGLTTTVTEILPPGRIHALAVTQSFLWRPFGWYRVRLIRMSGKNTNAGQVDQFQIVLPVGKRDDIERVLALLMPDIAASDWSYVFEHGMLGPHASDPLTVTPRRAWFIRPLSFTRNGFVMHPRALFLRRGQLWRSLAIFPLARVQSVAMSQGPIDRLARVATLQVHTVLGAFNGALGAIDSATVMTTWRQVEDAVIAAEDADRTHRWAGTMTAATDDGSRDEGENHEGA